MFGALLIALVAVFFLLWPVPMLPKRAGAVVLGARHWLRNYWDSQGG